MFTKRRILPVIFIICIVLSPFAVADGVKTYKIGVLVKRGTERCIAKWTATADYLTEAIDTANFEIVPLDFEQIYPTVEAEDVDFIITNPSFYVNLEAKYNVSRIATLKNLRQGNVCTVFGGVIFTRATSDINKLSDIKNRTFMAVQKTSFGGWQVVWQELKAYGIDPYKDFADLQFGGTHDAVIYAVFNGKVDAGTVRTDTLERLMAEGKINMNDYKILFGHDEHKHLIKDDDVHESFPFAHSTLLYPEWPFAKTADTPNEIAEKVTAALLLMSADSDAAKAAKCAGWTVPMNYSSVHNCLKKLRLAPYEDYGKISIAELIKQYWYWLLLTASVILTTVAFAIHIKRLNIKLRKSIANSKQSELKFQILYESSVDAVMLLDEKGFFDCNNATVQIFRCKDKAEFCTKHPADLSPANQPCGTDSMALANEQIATAMKKGSCHFEWVHQTVDGIEFPADVLLNAIELNGKKVLQAVVRDISERKQAEEELKKQKQQLEVMFHTAPFGLLLLDENLVIKKANSLAGKLVGREASEIVNDKAGNGLGCIHAHDSTDGCGHGSVCSQCVLRRTVEGVLSSEQAVRHAELQHTFMIDGNEITPWLEVTIEPLSIDDKKHILVAISNITERKQFENKSKQAQIDAEVANEAKSQFLANMSHEIRTPLNGVTGMLDLALDEQLSKKVYNYLLTCKSSAESLLNVINDILDISKIEAGKMDVEIIECSLNRMLIDIESLIHARAEEKGIEFGMVFDTPVPEIIQTDPTRVRQCLLNLVGNAIKFTDTGSVLVHVSMCGAEDDTAIRLDVKDTGVGIDKESQNKIFEKFSQADNTITRKFGGTGLGLPITKQLSELLGGSLSVTGEKGKGSTFTLTIPVGPVAKSQEMITELNRDTFAQNLNESQEKLSGKILLAEDNLVNQKVIQTMLEKAGLQVTIANDGREAIQKVTSEEYDLIFMDVHMPNVDGLEATRTLRQSGLDLPIIALTADVMKDDVNKTLKAGCNEHLPKPINRKKLFRVLDKYLSSECATLAEETDSEKFQQDEFIPSDSLSSTQGDDIEIPIDWSTITNNLEDEEMIMDVVKIFTEDASKTIQNLDEAIKTKTHEDVQLHAHSLKGISAMIGANQLREQACQLECAGRDKNTDEFDSLFNDVKEDFNKLMAFLSETNWMEIAKGHNKQYVG